MTPENAVFNTLFAMSNEIIGKENVYDFVSDGERALPFIFIREVTNTDESNSDLFGTVNVLMDVYGGRYDINVLDEVKVALHNGFIRLDDAFQYHVRLTNLSMTTREETVDRQTVRRVLINADFEYTRKEG